jgi:hypothetical protein
VPADLIARPAHSWPFEPVSRVAHRATEQDSSQRGGHD